MNHKSHRDLVWFRNEPGQETGAPSPLGPLKEPANTITQ